MRFTFPTTGLPLVEWVLVMGDPSSSRYWRTPCTQTVGGLPWLTTGSGSLKPCPRDAWGAGNHEASSGNVSRNGFGA